MTQAQRRVRLAGDIGGTKSLLGLFAAGAEITEPVSTETLLTADYTSAAAMLQAFLGERTIGSATLGVAGAVIDGRAQGSNLPWIVDAAELEAAIRAPVVLINDLAAIAAYVPALGPDDVVVLAEGVAVHNGPIGVIAPGTGMGQAMLFHVGGRYHVAASEAGHIDFAPNNELQADYLAFLRARFGHVSLERACSGGSFPLLFEFLAAAGFPPHPDVARAVERAEATTPAIIEAGLHGRCPASTLALEMFVEMLGAAAGNLALQIVATGGIYLAGGIPPRIVTALRHPRFFEAFTAKGRFGELASRIPVSVILDPGVGMLGAALTGRGDQHHGS